MGWSFTAKRASIGKAAVEFVAAGGDLCLVCHREDRVTEVYEELVDNAERDKKFAARVAGAARRVPTFKKKNAKMLGVQKELRQGGRR